MKEQRTSEKHNWKTNNNMMAQGLLAMLRESGGAPTINKLELSRRAGVPYIVVKSHCKKGFPVTEVKRVAAEFRAAASGSVNTKVTAARLMASARKNAVWFAIEAAGKSCFLREELAVAMREELTMHWAESDPAKLDELYLLFCGKCFRLMQEWVNAGCLDDLATACEIRLAALLDACANGWINKAVFD